MDAHRFFGVAVVTDANVWTTPRSYHICDENHKFRWQIAKADTLGSTLGRRHTLPIAVLWRVALGHASRRYRYIKNAWDTLPRWKSIAND